MTINGTISSAASQATFDADAELGNISSSSGSVRIGSFQYWKGNDDTLDVDAIIDIETEQTLYRWS